ncbi:MAG: hypothetical protein K8H88_04760 [Sandaracinaceae bacterium]|nr:hypothetical protein [Sandaracinaceae bacterium]
MDEGDRDAITKRRNLLIALALGGVTVTSATACACLGRLVQDGGMDAGEDAQAPPDDGGASADGPYENS